MSKSKKYFGLLIKVIIGVVSFLIIYTRLKDSFDIELLNRAFEKFSIIGLVGISLLLIILLAINWGIEAYKWKMIVNDIEAISYKTSIKSILSGVCVGNLAPGRATEFLAKIHFFKIENKGNITMLHFLNGMFQLIVTIFFGVIGLLFRFKTDGFSEDTWLVWIGLTLSAIIILTFLFFLRNTDFISRWIYMKIIKSDSELKSVRISFNKALKLLCLSVIRYAAFFAQFAIMLLLFSELNFSFHVASGVFLYFLFTTIIPMFSVIEAAVRTAIVLLVFVNALENSTVLVFCALMIWIINIVIPSIIGYFILLNEKLTLKSFVFKK